jgi:hypothetical protein
LGVEVLVLCGYSAVPESLCSHMATLPNKIGNFNYVVFVRQF